MPSWVMKVGWSLSLAGAVVQVLFAWLAWLKTRLLRGDASGADVHLVQCAGKDFVNRVHLG